MKGVSASADIGTVLLTDLVNLTTALGNNTTPVMQHQITDLRNDLMELAIEEAALTV
jgi:hypothetical protein